MDVTRADVEALAAKLDELDLSPGEKAALVAVFQTARETDDVAGFAYDLNPNQVSFKALVQEKGFNIGMPPTRGTVEVDYLR